MNKQSRSLWEYLVLPVFSPTQRRTSVSEREARVLYDIFKSGRDSNGKIVLPQDIDNTVVSSLTTKGYIVNQPSRIAIGNQALRTVDFTDKGRLLVRNLILHTEKSAFERGDIDSESIVKAISAPATVTKSSGKTASKIEISTSGTSWLKKAYGNHSEIEQ